MADSLAILRSDGFSTWRTLRGLRRHSYAARSATPVRMKQLRHPFYIRPGTVDFGAVVNNVCREEYGQVACNQAPAWMIDAGAYIGDTTAYFLSRYSSLRAVALEPNPETFEIARRNLDPYGERAILIQQGLFSSDGVQCFDGVDTGVAISATGHAVECTSISSIVERFHIDRIDILKMDIEGAEEAIFASNPEKWLSIVDMLIIEIHGRHLIPPIIEKLNKSGFSTSKYRSVWYCVRQ